MNLDWPGTARPWIWRDETFSKPSRRASIRKSSTARTRSRPGGTLDAVAGDGIQLRARARVTVRTNLEQLIGGAPKRRSWRRVGQGIVQAIGKQSSYKSCSKAPN